MCYKPSAPPHLLETHVFLLPCLRPLHAGQCGTAAVNDANFPETVACTTVGPVDLNQPEIYDVGKLRGGGGGGAGLRVGGGVGGDGNRPEPPPPAADPINLCSIM